MTKALIVVDVQNDFCEGGALAVSGGNNVARGIKTYLQDNGDQYDLVVATRDWHDADGDNGGHFSDTPDFVDSWPPHCVAGTTGAEYHPELWPSEGRYPHMVVRKGQGVPAYSGFEGTDAEGRLLAVLLRDANITDVDVVGLAFDYCVKATGIDAQTTDSPRASSRSFLLPSTSMVQRKVTLKRRVLSSLKVHNKRQT